MRNYKRRGIANKIGDLALSILGVPYNILLSCSNNAVSKGILGERIIHKKILRLMEYDEFIITDITLGNEKRSTQLDHVYISEYGIFVIETKNYGGYIYGDEDDSQWTQHIGRKKHTFYSPLKQNQGHVNALKKLLNTDIDFFNVVVFPRGNIRKVCCNNVYDYRNLYNMRNVNSGKRISTEDRKRIYDILLDIKNNPQVSRDEHIQNVRKRRRR